MVNGIAKTVEKSQNENKLKEFAENTYQSFKADKPVKPVCGLSNCYVDARTGAHFVIYYTYELQAKKYLFSSAYTFFFGAEYCRLDSGR